MNLLSKILIFCLLSIPAYAAVDFDGTNDRLVTSSIDLSSTSVITVSFWLYWDTNANNDDLALETGTNACTNQDGGVIIDPNSGAPCSGDVQVGICSGVGGNQRLEQFTRPTAATWHHWAIVFDHSTDDGDIKSYIDGALQSETICRDTKGLTGNFGNRVWNLMSRSGGTLAGAGKMMEFNIWNKELSAAEISNLHSSRLSRISLQTQPGNLSTYFPLDNFAEGVSVDGSVFFDMSANTETATGNGGASIVSEANRVVSYP